MTEDASATVLHASAVAFSGRGLLIRGASGSGKSTMALRLMSLGALLVSDDRTRVTLRDGRLSMTAPVAIRGMIEARGLGLLEAETCGQAPLSAILDLDRPETDRLPPRRSDTVLGVSVALLHNLDSPYFHFAVLQYLKSGRRD